MMIADGCFSVIDGNSMVLSRISAPDWWVNSHSTLPLEVKKGSGLKMKLLQMIKVISVRFKFQKFSNAIGSSSGLGVRVIT